MSNLSFQRVQKTSLLSHPVIIKLQLIVTSNTYDSPECRYRKRPCHGGNSKRQIYHTAFYSKLIQCSNEQLVIYNVHHLYWYWPLKEVHLEELFFVNIIFQSIRKWAYNLDAKIQFFLLQKLGSHVKFDLCIFKIKRFMPFFYL